MSQFLWYPVEPSPASPSAVCLCVVQTGSVTSRKPLQNKYGAMLRPWDQTHPWTRWRSIVTVHRRRHLTNWCFLPVQMTDTAHSIEHCHDAGKGCHAGTTQHFLLRQQRIERYSKGPRSDRGKPVRWLARTLHSHLLRDDRHRCVRRHSSLPWVGVHEYTTGMLISP